MPDKISLFYADWCGHCTRFKPTWDNLKKIFDLHKIQYEEFEADKNENKINENNIMSFPTILINKNNNIYEYNGSRDADGILNEMLPNLQKGGSNSKRYYISYN